VHLSWWLQVRYDHAVGAGTRLKFMTDGILMRELQVSHDLGHGDGVVLSGGVSLACGPQAPYYLLVGSICGQPSLSGSGTCHPHPQYWGVTMPGSWRVPDMPDQLATLHLHLLALPCRTTSCSPATARCWWMRHMSGHSTLTCSWVGGWVLGHECLWQIWVPHLSLLGLRPILYENN
jgi:hypothetical protein